MSTHKNNKSRHSRRSQWQIMQKGVPQGTVLCPVLFITFINKIIYELPGMCSLHSFENVTTIRCLQNESVSSANVELKWFEKMMWYEDRRLEYVKLKRVSFLILVMSWSNRSLVNVLGVLLDENISFYEHVSNLRMKAAWQTNALRRYEKYIPRIWWLYRSTLVEVI